jgi:hypothetical protein
MTSDVKKLFDIPVPSHLPNPPWAGIIYRIYDVIIAAQEEFGN